MERPWLMIWTHFCVFSSVSALERADLRSAATFLSLTYQSLKVEFRNREDAAHDVLEPLELKC